MRLETREQVMAWRRDERSRLIAARVAVPVAWRLEASQAIRARLAECIGDPAGLIISLYWPLRGEPDLRPCLTTLLERGARCALPVVVEKAHPLIFREWTPGSRLLPGVWDIPTPVDGAVITPDILIAPVVGFDPAAYRLGYGGGFFDRTLAARSDRPRVIGVGYETAAIDSIQPLPHDIAMNCIVTERRVLYPAATALP
jgi:5,10-methenyltetrahydrofolate synthetase